jgi:hypothetical protein
VRLLLHAGTHKTGTTSIQTALSTNRQWLRERGYIYPRLPGCGRDHNHFAHGIALATDPDDVAVLRSQLLEAANDGDTLVLSAEEFSARIARPRHWEGFEAEDYWERKLEYLRRLQNVVADFEEVVVHVCFRRQDEFASSLYATNLLSDRCRLSFDEFRQRLAPIFDYRTQIEAFTRTFETVRVKPFNTLKHHLVPSFFEWTGIPAPPSSEHRRKVSPDARLICWLYRRSAETDWKDDLHRLRANFARSERASCVLPSGGGVTLWSSEEERQAFLRCCVDPESGFFPSAEVEENRSGVLNETELEEIDAAFENWCLETRTQSSRIRGLVRLFRSSVIRIPAK